MSRHPRAVRRALAVATIALAVPLTGCADDLAESAAERAAEKAIEENGGGDVDIDIDEDGGNITVEGADGSFSSGGDLPEDFPGDEVPLVDGDIAFATSSDGSFSVNLTVDGSTEDVRADAVSQLEDAGFAVETDLGEAGIQLTDDTWDVFLIVVEGPPTSVQYAVTPAV